MKLSARLNKQEKQILALTGFGHFLCHLNMLVFPALAVPLATQMGRSLPEVLVLSQAMYLLFGVSALPWGFLADRIGARVPLGLMFIGCGASALGAAYWIDSPLGLAVHLAGLGLFAGIYHPVGLGLIGLRVRAVSLAMGYNGMAGNVGLVTAPLLTGFAVWAWGLGSAFLALGLTNLAGLALMAMANVPKTAANGPNAGPAKGSKALGAFALLLAAMMMGGIAYRGATVGLPALLELRSPAITNAVAQWWSAGSANFTANAVASLVYILGFAGQFLGGMAGERLNQPIMYAVFHIVAAAAALAMGWLVDAPLALMAGIYFIFLLGSQPLENTLVTRLSPQSWRNSAFGLKFVLTFGVGSVAVALVGAADAAWGVWAVFPVLAPMSITVAVLALILKQRLARVS